MSAPQRSTPLILRNRARCHGVWPLFAMGIAVGTGVSAQPASDGQRTGHAPSVLSQTLAATTPPLTVTSEAMVAGQPLPAKATQYGANRFPGLQWGPVPHGTASVVVVVQGEAAGGTSLHLIAYNLPGDMRALPEGLVSLPAGAAYGPNVHGVNAPYAGPHPHDDATHTYHWQVFALDKRLADGDLADTASLTTAMRGHVLASGDLVTPFTRPAAKPNNGTVTVESGALRGISGRTPGVMVYRGIPYAAPPVGDLRWHKPLPPITWAGIRDASSFGPACPQPSGEMVRDLPQSEDCLTANIWTSASPGSGDRQPVYVWIYGGGFIGGTGASPEFDGEALARKGIVVVTFNYRLGALGFLATPQLSRESAESVSGNYGLLDQIALLRWVQRNITAFGGDPARVTIGGQSAGAGSVGFLSLSPLARGLFRAGIAQSHARHPGDPELRYLSVSYRQLAAAESAGEAYAIAHGGTDPAVLRRVPWQQIIEGSNTVDTAVETGSDGKPPLFRPIVDGWVIPKGYAESYAAKAQNPVTFIAGNNKDETGAVPETAFAALRANPPPARAGIPQVNLTLAAFTTAARRKFGPLADRFLALYPAHDDAEAATQSDAAARDASRISTFLWGQLWTKGTSQPLYTYFWTHAPPGPSQPMRGAYHGSEIAYAFNSLDAVPRPWTEQDRAIGEIMSSYWANIIANGNPNGKGLPEWPRYDPAQPRVMELGDHFAPIPVAAPEKVAFWREFYQSQPQW